MNVEKTVTSLVLVIVGIVVVFYIVGALAPTLTDAATNISLSGLPLAGLFGSSGVVILLFMVGVFLAILFAVMRMHKSK